MPPPLLCLNTDVRQCAERFRSVFSKPHQKDSVTILRGPPEREGWSFSRASQAKWLCRPAGVDCAACVRSRRGLQMR
jgi:hypothetical protein